MANGLRATEGAEDTNALSSPTAAMAGVDAPPESSETAAVVDASPSHDGKAGVVSRQQLPLLPSQAPPLPPSLQSEPTSATAPGAPTLLLDLHHMNRSWRQKAAPVQGVKHVGRCFGRYLI